MLAMAGCAAIPVQRATGVDLTGSAAASSVPTLSQKAVGVGNVAVDVPQAAVSATWPPGGVANGLLAGAIGLAVVAIAWRKLLSHKTGAVEEVAALKAAAERREPRKDGE
jgi:hypothetical protein